VPQAAEFISALMKERLATIAAVAVVVLLLWFFLVTLHP
jgi:hypothetical protein